MNELIFAICTIVIVAALCHTQALLTRPELFFAVTVTTEFRRSATARTILSRYAALGWSGTFAALALVAVRLISGHVSVLLTVCIWLAAFLVARHSTSPHATKPTTRREVSLSNTDHRGFRGGLALTLGPAVIVAAKAIWVHLHWDDIPNRIPVHWGFNGPDRWVDRTPLGVYGFIATVGLAVVAMAFSGYATLHASRAVAAAGPEAVAERKFRLASFAGLLVLAYVLAIVAPPIEGVIPNIPFAPVLIVLASVAIVAALMYYGQGGTRLSDRESIINDPPVGDRTADDRWKLGMFYYNPDDPAFLVEKRFGIGWTWNFGHRLSWVLLPVLLLTILMPLLIR